MEYLTLEYIKKHSRIDLDCEDDLLAKYGSAAEQAVAQLLGRGKTVTEMVASLTEEYGDLPDAVYQATLMLVDLGYQYRNPVTPTSVNQVPGFDILIKPYMVL